VDCGCICYSAKLDAQPTSDGAEPEPVAVVAAAAPKEKVDDAVKSEADAAKDKGNEALKRSKFDEAVTHYTTAIGINPKDEVYFSNRSHAYLQMGKTTEALKDAEQCVALNGNWDKAYIRKGGALLKL
jgi:Flp pilus assembly protein TadD